MEGSRNFKNEECSKGFHLLFFAETPEEFWPGVW
jgi:hypothetical protein